MSWKLRELHDVIPFGSVTPDYDTAYDYFTIRVHHSGRFVTEGRFSYEGGKISHIDYVSTYELSKIELDSMVASIGFKGCLEYYYSCTGIDDVDILRPIKCDKNALELGLYAHGNTRIVGLFVDHDSLPMKDIMFPSIELMYRGEGSGSGNLDDSNHVDVSEGDDGEGRPSYTCDILDLNDIIDPNDSGESDGVVSVGSDSELSDYLGDSDGLYDIDNRDFNAYVDSDEEWGGLNSKDTKVKKLCTFPEKSGEIQVLSTNDMENKKVTLSLGMCFVDADEFRNAIRNHAIQLGRDLIFSINNKVKVQAKCKNKICDWLVYGSRGKGDDTFIIKTIYDKHTCPRLNKVVHANSRFLAEKYMEELKINPKWPVNAMMLRLEKENKVSFNKSQLYRCKKKVANLGNDDGGEQYSTLWRYAEEILHTNPGTTLRIKCKYMGENVIFKRMYLCWDALKRGLLDGCRRLICLDGCHLKTIHGGVLLSAVGIDSNNEIYPFAYAIVEKEKKKSWLWFLDLVIRDLDIQNSSLWTVISDKPKGLIDAVNERLPHYEHRFCVMHLYANFKLVHKGLALKSLLWKAARATRAVDFNLAMGELRSRNIQAFEWLQKRDPKHWSRSHFEYYPWLSYLILSVTNGDGNPSSREGEDEEHRMRGERR
ncbi:hypothetical protein OROHE_005455 [Orobanche hederae]